MEGLHLLGFKQVYLTFCKQQRWQFVPHSCYWPWRILRLGAKSVLTFPAWGDRALLLGSCGQDGSSRAQWKLCNGKQSGHCYPFFFPSVVLFYSKENVHCLLAGLFLADAWCLLCLVGLEFFFSLCYLQGIYENVVRSCLMFLGSRLWEASRDGVKQPPVSRLCLQNKLFLRKVK